MKIFRSEEEILRLLDLFDIGLCAFDQDKSSFTEWLKTPIPALNNQRPIELLTTLKGIEFVREMLLRMEYSLI